jgi:small subunit ribosomal protein S3
MVNLAKQFLQINELYARIKEYIFEKLKEAGVDNVDIQQFAAGIRIIIDVEKPKLALGPHGLKIKEIEEELKLKFNIKNVEIFINEVKEPALSASIMANRLASLIERGIHFRRAANLILKQIMDAGAKGAEIEISGKLDSDRARTERFRFGFMPKSGEPYEKYVKKAKTSILLKPGVYGISVKIFPPIEYWDEIPKLVDKIKSFEMGTNESKGT